jgi:hypothetical protein
MAIASNIGDAAERVPCVQNVRFGSLADIGQPIRDVRFAPESGHVQRRNRCLLCANSGRRLDLTTDGEIEKPDGEAGARVVDAATSRDVQARAEVRNNRYYRGLNWRERRAALDVSVLDPRPIFIASNISKTASADRAVSSSICPARAMNRSGQ